jgi:hypothetical protein
MNTLKPVTLVFAVRRFLLIVIGFLILKLFSLLFLASTKTYFNEKVKLGDVLKTIIIINEEKQQWNSL